MASPGSEVRGQTACAVDVSPNVVDAGAEITLQARVSCSPARDLRGHALLIKDHAGAEAARVELTEFDGNTNKTPEFVVKTPDRPGEHAWVAACPAFAREGISYAEASAPISFTVKPHATNVVVWDIPPAVVVGERFRIKVGIKCSLDCHFTNRVFGVYDHEGTQVGTGALSGDLWPGTTLYVSDVDLQAPAEEGLYTWSVKIPASDLTVAHAESSTGFGVRVVSHPEYLVTVQAIDKDSQAPLMGASVAMHPYKAVTDERGIAEVRVPKGAYNLFVSQTRYYTFGLPVEVTADMTARAELDVEPERERN